MNLIKPPLLAAALVCSIAPNIAQASGFALIEASGSGQGNAFAGAAASATDASTVFFNPAGMMNLDSDQMVIATHLIMPKSSFANNGSAAAALVGGTALSGASDDGGFNGLVPNFYWVKSLGDSKKFGLSVNAPFGLATRYKDDWVGRYHGVTSDLKIINVNPSFGYQVNDRLSVGGGLDVMLGTVKLGSAIDFGAICVASFNAATCSGLGALPQQADGFVDFDGDNYGNLSYGFNGGLMYALSDETDLGVAFRSEVNMKMKGNANFAVPAAASFVFANNLFVDSGINAKLTLPASLSFSLSHQRDQVTYLADITWTGWSSFDELRIKYDNSAQPDSATTENWNDTFRYSFGVDYQYSSNMVLRTGVAYDETPVPSAERRTPRLPGSDRTWLSFGLSYLMNENMSFDVGYSHLFIDNPKINNTFESSVPTLAATLTGEYSASVDILSAQLNWQY